MNLKFAALGPAPLRDQLRPTPRRLSALLLLLVAIAVPILRFRVSEAWASALWGLVVIGAFVGWGAGLRVWARPRMRPAWGLDGAVGAAFFLWVGGTLAVVHGVSKVTVWIVLLLGLVSLAIADPPPAPSDAAKRRWPTSTFMLAAAAVVALALLHYAEAVSNTNFNAWDDNMAYRQFAEKLIQTGSLYEPFSSRRLASMGGQVVLDAAVLAGAPDWRLHLLDTGICSLLSVALLLGYGAVPRRRAAGLLAAVLFITSADPGHNIGSEISGVLLLLALFCLFDRRTSSDASGWGHPILVALVASAICTLRQSYLPAAALTVAAACILRYLAEPRATRRRVVEETGRIALATFVALLPWMITSFVNARTFLYPVVTGNSNPNWGLLGSVSGWEEDRWFLINDFYFEPVRSIPLFVIAGCLLPAIRRTVAARAQLIGALLGFAMLVHSLRASVYYDSVERYYYAFEVAFACAVTLRVTSTRGPAAPRVWIPAVLVVCGIALHVVTNREDLQKIYTAWINGAEALRMSRVPDRKRPPDEMEKLYTRLQGAVPPRARMMVLVDYPYLLDFRRNDIVNYDQPGAVSPPPHVPYFQGPERFASYWMRFGIRYLAFEIGSSPEYNYGLWRGRLAETIRPGERGGMYKSQARYYLDAFDNLTALEKTRKILFQEGDYRVIDLAARR